MFWKCLRSMLAFGALVVISAPSHALLLTVNESTPTFIEWEFSGSFDETFNDETFTSGPWSLTVSSPIPTNYKDSDDDDWSFEVFLQYAGLTGGRLDRHSGNQLPEDSWGIDIFDCDFTGTGEYAEYAGRSGCSLSLGNPNPSRWIVGGTQAMSETVPVSVPAPATLLLFGLGLAGLGFGMRRR